MGYITYVTDQCPGETDILTGNAFSDLEIRDSEGRLLLNRRKCRRGKTHLMLI
ncbi:Uncharacterised protein [Escherichia coli]|nr:Uncharacterised protein [Escherichia coli]SQP69469.1 Uncharacterised protein [Escherichia coli]SQZ58093.1 Uncharacterised protein [Escherichia coli]SQZ92596.1 Uncharacterised protein [Escherichia coli]